MYDNIILKWEWQDMPEIDFLEVVLPCLLKRTQYVHENGHTAYRGRFGVFQVYVNEKVVKLDEGSLCKYWKGNNCDTLALEEVEEALKSIGEELGLPLEKATVERIDFSTNLEMDYVPSCYFPLLGSYPRRTRLAQENGVYFNTKTKTFSLLFYGKIEEYKAKKYEIPEEYQGKHLLRVELRLRKKAITQLKKDVVYATDLYDPSFFLRLLDLWHESYKKVVKVAESGMVLDATTTKKLEEQLASIGVLGMGMDNVLENIKRNYQSKQISKVEKQRQRQRVQDLVSKNSTLQNQGNNLIHELDTKMAGVVQHYRKSLSDEKLKN